MSRHQRRPAATPKYPVARCPACGKQAFTSKASAKRRAKVIYPGVKMRVYSCPGTPWWHMTSQDATRTAEMRDRLAIDK